MKNPSSLCRLEASVSKFFFGEAITSFRKQFRCEPTWATIRLFYQNARRDADRSFRFGDRVGPVAS